MKTACAKWKDALLEAALSGAVQGKLEDHLNACARCAEAFAALRARREHMDALLPLLAGGAEPPPAFPARLLGKARRLHEAKRVRPWRAWVFAGVPAAVLAAAILSALYWRREPAMDNVEWTAAQRLTDWRAPSDVLLETPGKEFLRATPKLGESYVKIPIKENKED